MVIQRIQTVWLLIALIFMVFIGIRPLATTSLGPVTLSDMPVLLIIDILIGVLLFLSIFMFKNLRLQKKVTVLSMVMMVVLGVVSAFFLYNNCPDATIEWGGGLVLLIFALIFGFLAYRGMTKDERKLKASDSLWR
ncbi:MAG: DUF4293 domain-containing protein [Muribaculaceae bacterium]|nr:DUF4293 domain-containing protein [Muribaculaceae bacterium]